MIEQGKTYDLRHLFVFSFKSAPWVCTGMVLLKLISAAVPALAVAVNAASIDTAQGVFLGRDLFDDMILPLIGAAGVIMYQWLSLGLVGCCRKYCIRSCAAR